MSRLEELCAAFLAELKSDSFEMLDFDNYLCFLSCKALNPSLRPSKKVFKLWELHSKTKDYLEYCQLACGKPILFDYIIILTNLSPIKMNMDTSFQSLEVANALNSLCGLDIVDFVDAEKWNWSHNGKILVDTDTPRLLRLKEYDHVLCTFNKKLSI